MIVHAHPYACIAGYLGFWALFLGGIVLAAHRASKRRDES